MSTIRDPAYITDAGRTMMTAGGDVTYTKAVLYGQDISHLTSDQVKALTTIGSPLREVKVGISDKQSTDRGTTVILEATFQNSNLKADLPYTAVGFFAQKGNDEKLIAVAVANAGAYLTATSPDGVATDALDLKLAIAIGDATNVTATVDPAGSVTPATLNGAINKLDHDLTAQIDTKANSADVYTKTETDNQINKFDLSKVKFRKQFLNSDGDKIDKTWSATKNDDGTYTIDLYNDDWTAAKLFDVICQLPNKADTSTVNAQIADVKNTIKSNVDNLQSAINTKANASDVYTKKQVDDAFSSRDATIATKADKATVDAEIAKIDFTPYAKTADVDTKINAVSDVVATKVGADYSYSKAQLDEKLLALSTDTNGKVSADQVTALIADKANKADVDKQIKDINDAVATKADKATVDAEISKIDFTPYAKTADVNAGLAQKDDTTDVDAKIKTVTDLANTKASQDSLNKLSQAVNTKADKATVDAQIAGIDFSKIKFRKQYLDSQGQTQDHTWKATKNTDGTYTIDLYNDDWTASKVHGLLAQLPTKADQSNVNSLVQDAKNTATSRADNLQSQITRIDGTTEIGAATDVNTLTGDPKSLRVYKLSNSDNKNTPYWCSDKRGDLVVINYDGNAKTQLWFGVGMGNSKSAGIRYWEGNNFPSWHKLAEDTDIDNLQTQINARLSLAGGNMNQRSTINWTGGGINDRTGNIGGLHWEGGTDRVDLFADQDGNDNLDLVIQLGDDNSNSVVIRNASGAQVARIDAGGNITSPTITTLQNQVNDLINQINYIKQNYLQGKRFPANQEAQAQQWENANPNGIAMIEK